MATYTQSFFKKAIQKYLYVNNTLMDVDVDIRFTYLPDTESIIINRWESTSLQQPTNDILKAYDPDTIDNELNNYKAYYYLVGQKNKLTEGDPNARSLFLIASELYSIRNGADGTQEEVEAYMRQKFGLE